MYFTGVMIGLFVTGPLMARTEFSLRKERGIFGQWPDLFISYFFGVLFWFLVPFVTIGIWMYIFLARKRRKQSYGQG
jgi:hypothetical protein